MTPAVLQCLLCLWALVQRFFSSLRSKTKTPETPSSPLEDDTVPDEPKARSRSSFPNLSSSDGASKNDYFMHEAYAMHVWEKRILDKADLPREDAAYQKRLLATGNQSADMTISSMDIGELQFASASDLAGSVGHVLDESLIIDILSSLQSSNAIDSFDTIGESTEDFVSFSTGETVSECASPDTPQSPEATWETEVATAMHAFRRRTDDNESALAMQPEDQRKLCIERYFLAAESVERNPRVEERPWGDRREDGSAPASECEVPAHFKFPVPLCVCNPRCGEQ